MNDTTNMPKKKKKYDIIHIGHVSKDIIIVKNKSSEGLGGAVYYSSIAAQRSGANVLVITKIADRDRALLSVFEEEGIEILVIPSKNTTSIENIYYTEDMDRRKVTLISQAEPFKIEEIPEDIESSIIHLAGLFYGEIPDSIIKPLSERAPIALDVQGILRRSENGKMLFKDWENKKEILPYVTYLKTDAAEAEIITGITDREKSARILHEWGAKEVMITHSSEVILYNGIQIYRQPFTPKNLSGRTGRGDTCFASYLAYRLTHSAEDSLRYTAVLTSVKMETPGAFKGTKREIEDKME